MRGNSPDFHCQPPLRERYRRIFVAMIPSRHHHHHRAVSGTVARRRAQTSRPVAAFRQRGVQTNQSTYFSAPEVWYEPCDRTEAHLVAQPPGEGYVHAVTLPEIRERLLDLPVEFSSAVEVVQLSQMTRKRALFPRYGMQWGPNIYLYPIEQSLVERYLRPPTPQQRIEARMYGGLWSQVGREWHLTWTPGTLRDFYLNNVLIHEIGHVVDLRNTNANKREQYANWFATEYGFRASRGRRSGQ